MMKSCQFGLMALVAGLPAIADAAPIVYEDVTAVKWSTNNTWTHIIGDSVFNTSRASVDYVGTDLIIRLFTNFPTAGVMVGGRLFGMADLAFDLDGNGTFEAGLAMTSHDDVIAGKFYEVPVWDTSVETWAGTGFIVAGAYDNCDPTQPGCSAANGAPPVRIDNVGDILGTATISESANSDATVPASRVYTVQLANASVAGVRDEFGLLWGTATCGNDTFFAQVSTGPRIASVPLPGTLALLTVAFAGAGLVPARSRQRLAAAVAGSVSSRRASASSAS